MTKEDHHRNIFFAVRLPTVALVLLAVLLLALPGGQPARTQATVNI